MRIFYPPATRPFHHRLLLPAALVLLSALQAKAQDVIVKQDKTSIQATVTEITDEIVRYKRFDMPDGPVYSLKKENIFMIVYKNGKSDTFSPAPKLEEAAPQPPVRTLVAKTPDAATQLPVEKPVAKKPVAETAHPVGSTVVPAAVAERVAATTQEVRKALSTSTIVKNPVRIMLGVGGYRVNYNDNPSLGAEWSPGPVLKASVEVLGLQEKIGFLSGLKNAGIGFASTTLPENEAGFKQGVDIETGQPNGSGQALTKSAYYTKFYLSTYLLKEFDTKFITLGILAGPGLNYTTGTYSVGTHDGRTWAYTKADASFMTGGLHTGQYLHKYLSTNKRGERNFFMRLGFDQFLMLKGTMSSTVYLSFGL